MRGAGFDDLIVKGLAVGAKGLFNLGRKGVAEGIKSDFARNKIKAICRQYLDELVDSTTDSLSAKIAGKGVAQAARQASGAGVDIHKAIGKLPKPKSGWTLPCLKYTGPYNDLEKQVRYDKDTGEILEIYDKPTGKTDAIAMQHDVDYSVCGDDKGCKHHADKKKWSELLTLCLERKDSGVIGLPEIQLMQKESLV